METGVFSDNFNIAVLFGAKTRSERIRRNWTQIHFAHLLNIPTAKLSKIERGFFFPEPETLSRITSLLRLQFHQLILPIAETKDDEIYEDMLRRLNLMKKNKLRFRVVYDVIADLSQNLLDGRVK